MAEIQIDQEELSRRGFLKAVVATAAAATAVGAGAGLLKNQQLNKVSVDAALPPVASQAVPTLPPASTAGESELLSRLAAVQAENVRLRAELDASQRSLQGVQQLSTDHTGALQTMRQELDTAHGEIGLLSGLVALYDQLDDVDLDEALEGGFSAVGAAVRELVDQLPSVNDGLQFGEEMLSQMEGHIPLLENGRHWLGSHVARVNTFYQAVEATLQTAVEQAGPFLQLLNSWFQDISKWLPFGIGKTAAQVMEALTQLLAETPNTISGLDTNVAQPLDVWLGSTGEEAPLRRDIIKPLREQALQRAASALQQAENVQVTYEADLVGPVQTAANRRRLIKTMITEYRNRHQI